MSAAQAIRQAALCGGIIALQQHEIKIIEAFMTHDALYAPWECDPVIQWGNFLLLVAEELSPTLPVDDLLMAADALDYVALQLSDASRKQHRECAVALRDLVKGE